MISEELSSYILCSVPFCKFIWCFLMIIMNLWVGEKSQEDEGNPLTSVLSQSVYCYHWQLILNLSLGNVIATFIFLLVDLFACLFFSHRFPYSSGFLQTRGPASTSRVLWLQVYATTQLILYSSFTVTDWP